MTRVAAAPQRASTSRRAVALLGIGTATPAQLSQQDSAALAKPLCCDLPDQEQFLDRVYSHSGVQFRASVLVDAEDLEYQRTHEFYRPRTGQQDRGPSTSERMRLYERYAPVMAESAAREALKHAEVAAAQITHVLPVTCTGFFSPGLDVELIGRVGLSPSVARVQVGFMGCHGAFNGISAATRIVQAQPGARVLVCCVELCSLHFSYGFDPQTIVANALFSDGAAAVVVGSAEAGDHAFPRITSSATMLIPDSLDAMTWRIGDHGFDMTLSAKVPDLVREHLPQWVGNWLAQREMSLSEIDMLAIHPGGPKVLTAVSQALSMPDAYTTPSREVLRTHGNMSSGTILFVLQSLISSRARGHCMALGFGPGLTAEAMLLDL